MTSPWKAFAAARKRFTTFVAVRLRNFIGADAAFESRARTYWDADVSLTIANLVQETETRASGRVQVITLAEFRTVIGELWDRYEDRILLIAETTISKMIGRGNTFIPQDKDTWLLLFPALEEKRAIDRADEIAARIGEKLMGAQFSEHAPPLPALHKLDLASAVNADGSIDLQRVKAAVIKVRSASEPKPAVRPTSRKPPIETGRTATGSGAAAKFAVTFRPAWNADTQSVDSFFFRAATPTGVPAFSHQTPHMGDAVHLDLFAGALRSFSEMCEQGLRATLTIPVPHATLLGSMAGEIRRSVAALNQQKRLLHLRLEIVQVPHTARPERLIAMREMFRPFVRDVAFLTDLFSPPENILALEHIALGAEIDPTIAQSDEELFQAMLLFRQRAAERQTYILGLRSRAQVMRAIATGLMEIGGPGIASDSRRLPQRVEVIRRDELLT